MIYGLGNVGHGLGLVRETLVCVSVFMSNAISDRAGPKA